MIIFFSKEKLSKYSNATEDKIFCLNYCDFFFFLAVLKLDVKVSFGNDKEIESMGKPSLQYDFIIYKHYLACILEWTWK